MNTNNWVRLQIVGGRTLYLKKSAIIAISPAPDENDTANVRSWVYTLDGEYWVVTENFKKLLEILE